jgi:ABC-type multidrug transport system permease subunit
MADRGGSGLAQLTLWRFRELWREPEALFWVFAFPILLALALGVAFGSRGPQALTVAVQAGAGADTLVAALDGAAGLRVLRLDSAEAYERLRSGRVALVVIPGDPVTVQYDSTRDESRLARLETDQALQIAAGRHDVLWLRDALITEPGSRYIDFLIPGLLGLNIMGTGMWGIGFGIVRARQGKLLRRFRASPMRRVDFLLAQALARLVFLVLEVVAVLAFGALAFDVPLRGSVVLLSAIVLAGALAFSGLGLLVASRTQTIEGVSGLMNFVMVPMWIFSGVFFSWSHFPDAIHPFIRLLPLTALNDGLRAVLLDGAGVGAVGLLLANMLAWGVASFALSVKIFRWT